MQPPPPTGCGYADERLDAAYAARTHGELTRLLEHYLFGEYASALQQFVWGEFADVYLEPKPFRLGGPRMWFGGQSLHPALLRRLVRYGDGFHPFGTPTPEELAMLRERMRAAGRDPDGLELVGGIRGRFPDDNATASIDEALEQVPAQLAAGYTSICFKPSMFTDDLAGVGPLCRELVARVAKL